MSRRFATILLAGSALVLLAPGTSAGGGCHSESEPTEARGSGRVTVHIAGCTYSPNILYVDPGTEVQWLAKDPVPHTVTGMDLSLHGDKYLNQGDSTRPMTFDEVGVFPYYCVIHPGMAAAVVVGDVGEKAATAEELPKMTSVVGGGEEVPPADPPAAPVSARADGDPSHVLPVALGLGAAAVLTTGVFVWRRRRASLPALSEGSTVRP